MKNKCGALMVSFDIREEGKEIVLVGSKPYGKGVEILNAFAGVDAQNILSALLTVSEANKEE